MNGKLERMVGNKMKIEIIDHTLCLFRGRKAYLLRLCSSIDGMFEIKGETLPWFKTTVIDRPTSKLYLYTVPYLCFGKSELK